MRRSSIPWWLVPPAAAYLAYFALTVYAEWCGPGMPGLRSVYPDGVMVVRAVLPDSQAESWGIEPGDRVLAFDGRPVRSVPEWIARRANLAAGRPLQIVVERHGQRRRLVVEPRARPPGDWRLTELAALANRLAQLVALVVAMVIAFRRPRDPTALLGAWFLATVATASMVPPPGFATAWRALPRWLDAAMWLPFVSGLWLSSIFLSFVCRFPRPLFRARWPWLLIWLPTVAALPRVLPYLVAMIYDPGRTVVVEASLLRLSALKNLLYTFLALALLAWSYRRLEEVNERRRIRVLALGLSLGSLGILPLFLAIYFPPAAPLSALALSWPGMILAYLLGITFSLSFAYAVLRHRLFDIRVIVRQGVRYALARRLLLSLVPLLALAMIADLLLHGDRPLLELLGRRGWIYALLAGLALYANHRRRHWLEALDRRFFRQRYDARLLLRRVVESVRTARSLEQVAARLVACAEAALHPELVAVLLRRPQAHRFACLASAPAGASVAELAADSELVLATRRQERPLALTRTTADGIAPAIELGSSDAALLERSRLELLVPVTRPADGPEVLLALGPRRSQEPYTREDETLLQDLASACALAFERSPADLRQPSGFGLCPRCGRCYDQREGRCETDGERLRPLPFPRRLAGRYHLLRQLGEGGMGTVYEARDEALERRVAVKLIAEHLVGSEQAALRFRHEAKIAARFAHPNLVTIYDFGIDAPRRAFLVMELLDGATLRQKLAAVGRLASPEALACLRQVAAGLEALHAKSMVHRDVKPENVFLAGRDPQARVKLLDFGIVKALGDGDPADPRTRDGLPGTLRYMAPERLRFEAVAPSWDLWALAIVAYETLTGFYPFAEPDRAAWRRNVLAGRVQPPSSRLRQPSPELDRFFARAFDPDPGRRPASARRLLHELERALA